jgi:hypothetical protein
MKELTHTLTGLDAASQKLLDEVQEIFHSKPVTAPSKDDWRLEYYIMQAMCSGFCSMYEIERNVIEAIVQSATHSAHVPKSEWDTAFRGLVRGGFLYSKRGNRVQFEPSRGKVTRYGLKLDRYDTDEVIA